MVKFIDPTVPAKSDIIPMKSYLPVTCTGDGADLGKYENQLANILDYYNIFYTEYDTETFFSTSDKSDFFDDHRVPIMVYAMYLQNFYTAVWESRNHEQDVSVFQILKDHLPLPEPEYILRNGLPNYPLIITVMAATNIAWIRYILGQWGGGFIPSYDLKYDTALPASSDVETVVTASLDWPMDHVLYETPTIMWRKIHKRLLFTDPVKQLEAERLDSFWDALADRYENVSERNKRFVQYNSTSRFNNVAVINPFHYY